MNVYMISYDLHSPTLNRELVEDSIKSIGTWCKYVSTTYLVRTYKSLDEVNKIATTKLDSNDRMIICKVQKPIAGFLPSDKWNWIHSNI